MINTITLNPSIDKFIRVDRLVKDDTLRGSDLHQDPGGKGINVSRALKELRGETHAFGFIGGCTGYMLNSYMVDRDIPFDFMEVEGETRINVILSDDSDNSQTRVSMPGPQVGLKDFVALIDKLIGTKTKPSFWTMGGSIAQGLPQDAYRTLIQIFQAQGVPCALDADGLALALGVEAKPYLIKPNEFEIQRLLDRRMASVADFMEGAQELVSRGIKVVALTLGKKGMIVASEKECFHVPSPEVKTKSKVGAGDSSLAGILFGLAQRKSLQEAARLGVAAGTAAVLTEGTQLFRKIDLESILSRIKVENIITHREDHARQNKQPVKVMDPVCGMPVTKDRASSSVYHQGNVILFCSQACRVQFVADPGKYTRTMAEEAAQGHSRMGDTAS